MFLNFFKPDVPRKTTFVCRNKKLSLPGCGFADSDVRDILSPGPDLLYYGGGEEGAELQLDGNPESTVSPWDAAGAQHWYPPLSSTCLN